MGIGTLIVFIAMVLVAAIAAGVLINTAGFLQTQAEATGEESTAQVSERLQVVSQSGTIGVDIGADEEDGIDELEFVVSMAPGADSIDLSETSVELIGPDGQETFTLEESQIDIFQGEDEVVLTSNSDRATVTLDLTDTDLGYELVESDRLSVTFSTPAGATTTTEIRVPTTLTGDEEDSVRL